MVHLKVGRVDSENMNFTSNLHMCYNAGIRVYKHETEIII